MVDLFIAVAAVMTVIWVIVLKVKAYKKNGAAFFGGRNCSRCNENCAAKK